MRALKVCGTSAISFSSTKLFYRTFSSRQGMTRNNPKTTRRHLVAIGQRAPTSIVLWGGTDIMIRKTYRLCFACLLLVVASGCTKRTQPAAVIPTIQLGAASITSDDPGTRSSLSLTPFRQADLAFKSSGIVDQTR